jgi:transcriptional regulator with XRE-family HTH domain
VSGTDAVGRKSRSDSRNPRRPQTPHEGVLLPIRRRRPATLVEGKPQQEAADRLNTTQSRLSKLEKGTQALRGVTELRHIATAIGIPPERLGVLPDHSQAGAIVS